MESSLKPHNLILRCYAEEENDGSWFSICLDLNLYARGESFHEVRTKLNRLAACYIKEAVEKDAAYITDLIPRRAPMNFWIRYAIARMLHILHRKSTSKQEFKMPLPLVPAV